MKNCKAFAKIAKLLKEQERELSHSSSPSQVANIKSVILTVEPMSLPFSVYVNLNNQFGRTGLKLVLKQTK